MAEHVTKEDLEHLSKEIKDHILLLITPIKKDVENLETVLLGKSRLNGVAGTVKGLCTKTNVVYILLAFIAAAIVKIEIWGL